MRNRYDNFPNRCSVLFCVVLLLMFVCIVTVCACCCWFFSVYCCFLYVSATAVDNVMFIEAFNEIWYAQTKLRRNGIKKQQPLVKATWVSLAQQIPMCRSKWQPKIYAQIFVSNNTCGKIKKKKPNLFSTVDRFF